MSVSPSPSCSRIFLPPPLPAGGLGAGPSVLPALPLLARLPFPGIVSGGCFKIMSMWRNHRENATLCRKQRKSGIARKDQKLCCRMKLQSTNHD